WAECRRGLEMHFVCSNSNSNFTRTLKTRADAKAAEQVHEENGDLEVRRSCRLRQSRYTTTNQSVLFDKLITNTAEAVLQKMDDMEKMRRRRMMEDLGVFHDPEVDTNLLYYFCISSVFHIVKLFICNFNLAEITSSKKCLPVNFQKDDLKGIHKDRMKIGASLADVDPMQRDCSVRFDGVGGLSDHISALKEMVVFPLLYPEVFERFKIQPPRGCLFYGPPGTGKTLVARALANECSQGDRRIAFFMRKGADCLSKWVGESERQLRLLFDQAYQMRPSIIFFDEIDGLAPVRSSKQDQVHSSIVSTLLALLDGLDSRGEIVVIGATNRLDSIDPALRRPGRFDREFLFNLPNKEARKEIFKIHTRDWTPKPLDTFLEELAEKCVGYCGADIKSLCAEAALCALRRRYPQIYKSSQKLQLDVASIKITAKDFVTAMQKTVPASQRAVASPGQALSPVSKPLFQNTLARILEALQRVFPHAKFLTNLSCLSDSLNDILRNDVIDSDEESLSIFEDKPMDKMPGRQKKKFLDFSRNAYNQPTSCRPRFLLVGEPGCGQTSHLAPAVIHALEKFPVYTLDLSVLFVSATSPEETCAQLMREAQRTAPSIIYIPHIHLWWEAVGTTLKATFTMLLQNIPAFAPVLLLATSDVHHADLPKEVNELFINDYEVFKVELPSTDERSMFFEDLVVNQVAKPPSKNKAARRPLEVLPIAPPPKPLQLTEEEIRRLEEQEEDTLRELRIFLRGVADKLVADRRFRAFTKPVDPEEVPDYETVVKRPMELSTVVTKIDLHQYLTARDFLQDINLICTNALEYNSAKDPGGRLIRHRACTLRDTAYSIVKEGLDEDFEQRCEEIKESRKKRGCGSSKHAPSSYHVMPKQNSVPGCKKTDPKCNEKMKMPAEPVDSSTPHMSKRKRKKNKGSSSTTTKRRNFQFNKENKVPEDQNEVESDEGSQEKHVTNMDHTEVEPSQDSLMEENENILQERQKNGNENKSGTENERGRVILVAKSASGKKSVMLPEHSDLRKESDMLDCQMLEKPMQRILRYSKLVLFYFFLQQLLQLVTALTKNLSVFHLEKLYALLSQCIYQHREDADKTELVQVNFFVL
uniref:ATPase family AAA domain-containing protein 2 n=1 Tax=Buteo japonicus TaxID=224669 RepID=A0A8C0B1C9_9AVES